ncbi:glycosyltransferase [Scytonema sp. PRP1]
MLHKRDNKKAQEKPAVALIFPDFYAGITQSFVNSARYLARQGYLVDVFTIQDDRLLLKSFDDENIKIYFIETPIVDKLLKIFPKVTYFFNPILKGFEDAIHFWIPPNSYSFIIGFDPEGLIRAGILSQVWRVPYIYHSLEIYEHSPVAPKKEQFRKQLEDWFSRRALFCFSQDEKRCQVLAEENGLKLEKTLVVYNSCLGREILSKKDDFLKKKFNIGNDKYIVLAVGSLIPEHCIDQIVLSVDEWPDNFVLVLHGWFGEQKSERFIRHEIELRKEKVFVSTDLLDGDQKYKVFQSADVGLVFFQAVKEHFTKNFIYAAGSSGKLFDFMRTGVPIIASDIPGMREIVENKKCGMVVKSPKDIGGVLPKIMEDYELLSKNSLESYSSYEFGQCYSQVLERIQGEIA